MKWIEVFRGGPQTDSQGRKQDGDRLIDAAVATFNAARYEPPAVIGHPQTNSPAWGWVGGLRKAVKGGAAVLEAGLSRIHPKLEKMVKQGLFRKVSASFWEDGRLRHVGFLGAAAPAVEGLAPVSFSDGSGTIDFEMPVKAGSASVNTLLARLQFVRDWLLKNQDAATAESLVPSALFAGMETGPTASEFTQADLEQARAEGAATARVEAEKGKRRFEIAVRLDGLVNSGKLPPTFLEAGIKDFCEFLGDAGGTIEFAEGSGIEAAPPVEYFLDFIDRFSSFGPMFSGFATKGRFDNTKLDTAVETGKDLARRASR